jgi:transglutaminase-like putative cysteine protease
MTRRPNAFDDPRLTPMSVHRLHAGMTRRSFVRSVAALASGALPVAARGELVARFAPSPASGWREFEMTVRVELPQAQGGTRVWIPLPGFRDDGWAVPIANEWNGNAATLAPWTDPASGTSMLCARWEDGTDTPSVEVRSRFRTRDRAVDLDHPPGAAAPALDPADAKRYTDPTRSIPTDGIVRKTALQVTHGARSERAKATAIYDWIVENTARNPKTRGCGRGDIRFMLESGDLTGKCADLNALFVGLARAAGLPARDVYGIRVADSRYGYRSLGKSGDITKAQHCRAEIWLSGLGWIPADPADVRKVALEERPGLRLEDDAVVAVRRALFGAWEMNWVPYNCGHDVPLPGSAGAPVPFLMYPIGENAEGRFDSLDPDGFRYRIASREIVV